MSVEAPVSGPTFEAAPTMRISGIVNEGPLTRREVENSMTLTVNQPKLIGEIRFNPEQTQNESSIPQVFLEAFETSDSKARRIWEEVRSQPDLTADMLERALLTKDTVTRTKVVSQEQVSPLTFLQPETKSGLETKAVNGHSYSLPHPGYNHMPVEKTIKKEEMLFEKKANKTPHAVAEERIEIKKKRFVLDERALGVVIVEISAAVRKASVLAQRLGRKITGSLIARFLPGQHTGNESEAVKEKGSDGSIPTREEVIKEHGEFATYEEAEKSSLKVADEIPPIKIRDEGEGKSVRDEDVYTVYKDHPVKPDLSELNISEQLTATKVEVRTGSKIEDYPDLAEVFEIK